MSIKSEELLIQINNSLISINNKLNEDKPSFINKLFKSWQFKIKKKREAKKRAKIEKQVYNLWLDAEKHKPTKHPFYSSVCIVTNRDNYECIKVNLDICYFDFKLNKWYLMSNGNEIDYKVTHFFEFK